MKFLLLLLSIISINCLGTVIDMNCSQKSCILKLKSTTPIQKSQWTINNEIIETASEQVTVPTDDRLEFVSYKVRFLEEGRGEEFNVLEGRLKNINHNPSLGQSENIYNGRIGNYIGIPFQKGTKLIANEQYELVTDHVAKIKPNAIITTIHSVDANGKLIIEEQISNRPTSVGYSRIDIFEKKFSEHKTVIDGSIETNIQPKSISNIEVSINGINIKTKGKYFRFVSEQPILNIMAKVHIINMKPLIESMVITNPLIEESECEFELQNGILSTFCMSDIASIDSTQFYIEEYEVGKNGEVSVKEGEENSFTLVLTLSNKDLITYHVSVSPKGEVDVQRQE